jgi:hypothetical protein
LLQHEKLSDIGVQLTDVRFVQMGDSVENFRILVRTQRSSSSRLRLNVSGSSNETNTAKPMAGPDRRQKYQRGIQLGLLPAASSIAAITKSVAV